MNSAKIFQVALHKPNDHPTIVEVHTDIVETRVDAFRWTHEDAEMKSTT